MKGVAQRVQRSIRVGAPMEIEDPFPTQAVLKPRQHFWRTLLRLFDVAFYVRHRHCHPSLIFGLERGQKFDDLGGDRSSARIHVFFAWCFRSAAHAGIPMAVRLADAAPLSARNVGFNQFGQLFHGLLPSEVAHFDRNHTWYSLLDDTDFRSTGYLF